MRRTRWTAISKLPAAYSLLGFLCLVFVSAALLVAAPADKPKTARTLGDDETTEEKDDGKPKRNPFVPRKGYSVEELFEYIERLEGAPRTVQAQKEFGPALVICAERILEQKPNDTMKAY